jgi:hypothetical protein
MHAASHAKNAKGAKVGNEDNNGFELWYSALLGDLGALCVMRRPPHAKNAKG